MRNIIDNDSSSQANKDTIFFLHGTKTTYDSLWMEQVAKILSKSSHRVIRPEFPDIYKENSEESDKTPECTNAFRMYVESGKFTGPITIVGKSLGAKVAVEYASKYDVKDIILFGYPMTYQKTGDLREDQLEKLNELNIPVTIIQGENDKYGNRSVIQNLDFSENIQFYWIKNVDHSLYLPGENELSVDTIKTIERAMKDLLIYSE
jgi:predicted alpha/beta-hydrolase family hydrolase